MHNHEAFDGASASPSGRALPGEARERVLLLTSAGVKPYISVASIHNDSIINATVQYITTSVTMIAL